MQVSNSPWKFKSVKGDTHDPNYQYYQQDGVFELDFDLDGGWRQDFAIQLNNEPLRCTPVTDGACDLIKVLDEYKWSFNINVGDYGPLQASQIYNASTAAGIQVSHSNPAIPLEYDAIRDPNTLGFDERTVFKRQVDLQQPINYVGDFNPDDGITLARADEANPNLMAYTPDINGDTRTVNLYQTPWPFRDLVFAVGIKWWGTESSDGDDQPSNYDIEFTFQLRYHLERVTGFKVATLRQDLSQYASPPQVGSS